MTWEISSHSSQIEKNRSVAIRKFACLQFRFNILRILC